MHGGACVTRAGLLCRSGLAGAHDGRMREHRVGFHGASVHGGACVTRAGLLCRSGLAGAHDGRMWEHRLRFHGASVHGGACVTRAGLLCRSGLAGARDCGMRRRGSRHRQRPARAAAPVQRVCARRQQRAGLQGCACMGGHIRGMLSMQLCCFCWILDVQKLKCLAAGGTPPVPVRLEGSDVPVQRSLSLLCLFRHAGAWQSCRRVPPARSCKGAAGPDYAAGTTVTADASPWRQAAPCVLSCGAQAGWRDAAQSGEAS